MPVRTYTTFKCPYCKCKLETREGIPFRIGKPLVTCPRCGRTILASNMGNEWQLLSVAQQRAVWFMGTVLAALGAGIGAGCIVFFLGGLVFETTINTYLLVALAATVAVLVRPMCVASMRNAIAESDQRMSDPEYREELRRYGLLK